MYSELLAQSPGGSYVITNTVIIQIHNENLLVLFIIYWPLIRCYSDCKVHYIRLTKG